MRAEYKLQLRTRFISFLKFVQQRISTCVTLLQLPNFVGGVGEEQRPSSEHGTSPIMQSSSGNGASEGPTLGADVRVALGRYGGEGCVTDECLARC
jgi:hypothetical protein